MDKMLGFEEKGGRQRVCKLKKSLYRLKQSPRAWFKCFGKGMTSHSYTQSQANHTMVFKHSCEDKIAILIVYVDDIILTSDDSLEIERLKGLLAQDFEIKDLGTLKHLLGMEFERSRKGIFVS